MSNLYAWPRDGGSLNLVWLCTEHDTEANQSLFLHTLGWPAARRMNLLKQDPAIIKCAMCEAVKWACQAETSATMQVTTAGDDTLCLQSDDWMKAHFNTK